MKTSLKFMALLFLSVTASIAMAAGKKAPQAEGVQDLMDATNGQAKVSVDAHTGLARFIQLPPQAQAASVAGDSATAAASPQLRAMSFLRNHGSAFGVSDANAELTAVRTTRDSMGNQHSVFRQTHDGLPVFGGELRAHFNTNGDLFVVNGVFASEIKVNPNPSLTSDEAAARAIRAVTLSQFERNKESARQAGSVANPSEDFDKLNAVGTQLMVFRAGLVQGVPGRDHLAFEVEVSNATSTVREFVYVDAHNGKVIDQITGIHEAKDRRAFDAMGLTAPGPNYPATPFWTEGDPFPTTDIEADNMILASGETYDLFMNAFGRDGYDGGGATMDSIFNRGNGCPNASWNGIYISFCPGLTTDDITGHEWGHAYTEYTSNLIYQWQSGALNESFSDIWGETVDLINGRDSGIPEPSGPRTDGNCSDYGNGGPGDDSVRWLQGEDYGAIRDMWNPNCYGDPGYVTDPVYWCSTGDNGGVHINSGIPNHAFSLMVDGGNFNSYSGGGLGLIKAVHIEWAASLMLSQASNFADDADALEAACGNLIGVDLADLITGAPSGEIIDAGNCSEVSDIIDAVELREAVPCNFDTLLDPDAPALCEGFGSVETTSFEDFEGGSLPAGWTVSSHDVVDPGTFDNPGWSVVSGTPAGGPAGSYSAFVPDLNAGDCAADTEAGAVSLDSPAITLAAGAPPHVAFDHWVATELAWDGGNVKVSVNGGPWTLVPADHYSFNPYNSTLNVSDNPLGGEDAFTGADQGSVGGSWGQSQVDLFGLAFPGDEVQLRFDFGVDGCFGTFGWYVDDVHVYSCSDEALPICGDGLLDPGEMCDDGNMDDGDGCSSVCQVEDGWVCSDPTSGIGNTTLSEGFEGGVVPPADWTTEIANADATWQLHTFNPNSGSFAADVVYDPFLVPQDEWLLSPSFTPAADSVLQYASLGSLFWCRDSFDNCDLDVYIVVGDVGGGDDVFVARADDSWPASYTWVDATEDLSSLLPGGPVRLGFRYTGLDGAQAAVDDILVGEIVHNPSICNEIVEDLVCNAGMVEFDAGIADSWTVVDNEGTGVVWTDIISSDIGGNFTGGSGDAATVNSDANLFTEFDSELITNSFSLQNQASAFLDYLVNYQNLAGLDFLDVDISTDGGSSWTNLLSWNEDHPPGGLFTPPGEAVSLDLSAYLGETDVQVRWRYYDPNSFDWDWYAQVDNVALTAPDDEDCDGVVDSIDACPGTVISESVPTQGLGKNRWALTDSDADFDTNGKQSPAYTLQDTAGCSCEQIIENLDLGEGHTKFGCSNSAMKDWISLMSQ